VATLPPDFEFRHFIDGPALYLGDEAVAYASPARDEPGAPWRLYKTARRPPRYAFLPDEQACREYLTRWAIQWEAQIREACASADQPFQHLASGDQPREPSRHPRPRSRRRSRLF